MSDINDTTNPSGADREQSETTTIAPDQVEGMDYQPDDVGTRIETFISPRTFIDKDAILPLIAGKPRGFGVQLGRIAGYATSCERRENTAGLKGQDGKPVPPSVWIKGEFEATILATGELRSARFLILPRAAGELIEEAFSAGAQRAFMDIELGLEATGRTIPYAYTVTAYGGRDSESRRAVRAIRARQEQRALARSQTRQRAIEDGGGDRS